MKLVNGLSILVGILACGSVFAQGGGISGPNNSGSKVSTDEKVLTRADLKGILGGCMNIELLEMARILSKSGTLVYAQSGVGGGTFVKTSDGIPTTSTNLEVSDEFHSPSLPDGSMGRQVWGSISSLIYNNNYSGWFEIKFMMLADNDLQPRLDISLVARQAPQLQYTEAALPGAYDEYGNVIQEKIVIAKTAWMDHEPYSSRPIDLVTPIKLVNSQTNQEVIGVEFKQARYIQCVDLGLGKYDPSTR